MTAPGFALFETAIGQCGIAWSARGVIGVQLPEASALKTRARLLRRCPQAREAPPPADVQRAIDGIVALLGGEPTDLSAVALDLDGRSGARPPGLRGRAHHRVAARPAPTARSPFELGERSLARDVGQALGRNPFPLIVPCHRVLAAGGKVGGFSANGGVTTKLRLLTIERARTSDAPTLFDGDGGLGFAVKPKARAR